MTPQERQLVAELFDRLASLEGGQRDPEAERAIAEGLSRAPNAAYALVQTVLVQDEALKRADARIQELEANSSGAAQQGSGFLDGMRTALGGRDTAARGSVPSLGGKWNTGQAVAQTAPPYAAPNQEPMGRGGSFLGTAAAAAAGVIGGSLLFSGIQSLMGGHHGGAYAGAYGSPDGGERRSPWSGDASRSDLARDAGVNDINPGHAPADDTRRAAGLFGNDNDTTDEDGDDSANGDDADFGDTSDA